jgi:hypothetical protein
MFKKKKVKLHIEALSPLARIARGHDDILALEDMGIDTLVIQAKFMIVTETFNLIVPSCLLLLFFVSSSHMDAIYGCHP